MHVASVGQVPNAAAMQKPEAAEARGPDHDGDSDDAGASKVKSSPPPGAGSVVDTTA